MSLSFLLIGHRATGKSTLGRRLAEALDLTFFDLDAMIEERTGTSSAALVAEDEAAFREHERRAIAALADDGTAKVVASGGGLEHFPLAFTVIWLSRDGWEEDALSGRQRLRPERSAAEEIAWMKQARDPRYRAAAHYHLHLERGCTEEEAAARLHFIASWLQNAVGSAGMRKSWLLPRSGGDLERCCADVRRFGMAGVELRSDMFPATPSVDVPWLASLRTEDPDFFRACRDASAFDCDVRMLPHMDLRGLEPRTLILSSHPDDVYKEFFDYLTSLPEWIAATWPEWKDHVVLKYAPRVKSWVELRYAYQLYKVYEKQGGKITFLPQGKNWKWVRALRLHVGNALNYLSSGCDEDSHLPPTIDYFLPHMQHPPAEDFYGIIGDPVEQSWGDVFHRALSLHADGGRAAYLKIPLKQAEIDNCLHLLPQWGFYFKGLSVTSPLKRAVVASNFVGCESDLPAGNTLALIKGSFLLYDTDEAGMRAALEEIEASGVEPGETVVFGSGGVTPALQRALDARGWTPVHVRSAREGWDSRSQDQVALVVNASGGDDIDGAPRARAWLDLRYREIARAPAQADHFFNGMTFFRHQALAQRELWELARTDGHPLL